MWDKERLASQLSNGLHQLQLNTEPTLIQALLDYLQLLLKWNATHNLTAIREAPAAVTRHLLDSLAVAPYLHGDNIIDVGTGGGLPGIPLALYFPEKSFVLVDSIGKKAQFLMHVQRQLKLSNVSVIQQRIETYQPEQLFTTIVSRAFSQLNSFVEKTAHLCATDGIFLAMKGTYPQQELAELSCSFHLENSIQLHIPDLAEQRHVLCIRKTA